MFMTIHCGDQGGVGRGAKPSAYDPVLDRRQAVRVLSDRDGTLKLELTAVDYPVLLEVEEIQ